MTTLLAILILVGFTVGMCYLVGDEYTEGSDGRPVYTTFIGKVQSGCKILFGVVGFFAAVFLTISAVIWAIKELIGG